MRPESAPQALEPVCNITQTSSHQRFDTIFQSGFSDPALSNAVMLALSFAANEYQVTQECLAYKDNTIRHINQKIGGSLDSSVSKTMGAILLLVGIEVSTADHLRSSQTKWNVQWRLGAKSQVQLHLGGIMHLLQLCNLQRIRLHDGVKRCVF